MPTAPTVSVVMATYNGAAYVAEQLRSILEQRCPPLEIVIGDDQSTDDTVQTIGEMASTSGIPIDLVVNETRLGHADNFLRAAVRARGDLIALADQDDVWLPDKLALAVAALSDPAVALWVHDRTMVDEQLRPTRERRFHTGISKRASRANPLHPMHGSRMVFRAGALHYFPGEGRARSVFGDACQARVPGPRAALSGRAPSRATVSASRSARQASTPLRTGSPSGASLAAQRSTLPRIQVASASLRSRATVSAGQPPNTA